MLQLVIKSFVTSQHFASTFSGSSGNGKTELARYLSDLINKPGSSGSYFHKCDCGKLSNAHELFGMSGAYYGSEAGSALNNFIVKMSTEPQSIGIVLLDEVEKAEREVITALYQVFDKGEWTNKRFKSDVQTEIISCRNISS